MDRFSDLPDEVLCLILSFLTTKEAALTSILAKRWRNLLAFVPCLTINDTEFLHPEEGKQDRQEIKESFIEFVDRVLKLQGSNSPLKKFSLECCVTVGDWDRVDSWINLVDAQIVFFLSVFRFKILRERDDDSWLTDIVSRLYSNVWKFFHGIRNVQNLDLSPDALEVLFLCCESMPWFNNLKSLTIRSEEDRGWQAMPALLRNCPHLETLVLEGLVHDVTDKCGDACDCISREDKGLSLTLCPVTVMEIHGFQGTDKELAMIEHFLNNLPSLKKMEVYAEENDPTQLRNREIVLKTFELYGKISSCNVKLCI